MPVFIFPQPGGGNPILNFILGLAVLAVVGGLVIFFLPVLFGLVVVLIALGLLLYLWSWIRVKFGGESEEVKTFREAMEQAEAAARRTYGRNDSVYAGEEEVVLTRIERTTPKKPRRQMDDVEDIQENRS